MIGWPLTEVTKRCYSLATFSKSRFRDDGNGNDRESLPRQYSSTLAVFGTPVQLPPGKHVIWLKSRESQGNRKFWLLSVKHVLELKSRESQVPVRTTGSFDYCLWNILELKSRESQVPVRATGSFDYCLWNKQMLACENRRILRLLLCTAENTVCETERKNDFPDVTGFVLTATNKKSRKNGKVIHTRALALILKAGVLRTCQCGETPKLFCHTDKRCLLCATPVPVSKDKLKVFGRTQLDLGSL